MGEMTLQDFIIGQRTPCKQCGAEIPKGHINVFEGNFYCDTCAKFKKPAKEKIGKYSGPTARMKGAYELY
jgi:hypothetical protein